MPLLHCCRNEVQAIPSTKTSFGAMMVYFKIYNQMMYQLPICVRNVVIIHFLSTILANSRYNHVNYIRSFDIYSNNCSDDVYLGHQSNVVECVSCSKRLFPANEVRRKKGETKFRLCFHTN